MDDLRTALAEIAPEVDTASALEVFRDRRRRDRRRRRAGALIAVVAILGVAPFVVSAVDTGGRETVIAGGSRRSATDKGAELVDTDWVLVGAQKGDVQLDGGGREARVGFTRCTSADCTTPYRIGGNVGCNTFGGFVDIIGSELRLDRVEPGFLAPTGGATAMGCSDEMSPVVSRLFMSGSINFERDGDSLRLSGGDVDVVYQRTTEKFPPAEGLVVAQGNQAGDLWRLTTRREGDVTQLELMVRSRDLPSAGAGGGVGTSVGSTDTSDSQQIVPLGSGQLVYGIAPARAARVTAEVEGHEPVDLDMHDLADSGGLRAFVGYTSSGTATIRIHDASGVVIQQQDNRPG